MNRSTFIIGLTLLAGMSLIGAWAWISRPAEEIVPQRYIEAPGELAEFVRLGRVGILTSENFIGHRIRVIEGTFTNVSNETLRSVEVLLTFRGVDGDAILESSKEALQGPLVPGAEREYVFRYENLPPEWDYRVPEVSLVRIGI